MKINSAKYGNKRIIIVGVIAIAVIVSIASQVNFEENEILSESNFPKGEKQIIEGKEHLQEGTPIAYQTNPPTSGDHWPQFAELGIYDFPLPDQQLVHNLEHGAIWISYNGIDEKTKQSLEDIAKKYPKAVIMTPRPQNDKKIALASWGYLDAFDDFDEQRILEFIRSNINNSPEPIASLEQNIVKVGMKFPEFEVIEVSGKPSQMSHSKASQQLFGLPHLGAPPAK